ncbi:alpha/beta fold hydrolase [Azospirillum melinis]|uniref:alpha/beta hydrolase n=1 Tax=Azospirillum melinis TaxID=328839 RepID=UPI0037580C68
MTTAVSDQDRLIPTPTGAGFGRLYVKDWTPAAAGDLPPILLFHDSLGCVDLWRSFPARLAAATARRVIAYDRLGFGRSDPHPGTLPRDFVAAEARDAVPLLLDSFGIGDFVVCGHSVGGGMAVETAARFPLPLPRAGDHRSPGFRRGAHAGRHPRGEAGLPGSGPAGPSGEIPGRQGALDGRCLDRKLAVPRLRRLDPGRRPGRCPLPGSGPAWRPRRIRIGRAPGPHRRRSRKRPPPARYRPRPSPRMRGGGGGGDPVFPQRTLTPAPSAASSSSASSPTR